ncbi:VOC family protein [Streptomyces sp. NPDC046831]|uniref:VOC family protein n=1 Tax=Streptomyces sp. NPDC046831 TaxID=3154805 RepID=UPI0033DD372F
MTEAARPRDSSDGEDARYAPGVPCWVSLMVRDPVSTQAFYGALFGWQFEPGPRQFGPSVRALLGGRDVAGIGRLSPDRPRPVAWTPYFASGDVERTAERVRSCGGTIGVGPLDAGGAGRLAIACDPSGAVFGIRQAAAPRASAVTGVPGSPGRHELLTYEAAGVAAFYATVFGLEKTPGADGQADPAGDGQAALSLSGRPVAAVHGLGRALPADLGPHWLTYFDVAGLDDALGRVVRLGGQVLVPAHDGAHGRVAQVTDPDGTRFALLQRPRRRPGPQMATSR